MYGSIRQRSAGSWELRAYVGVNSETGRRLDRSITVRGNRRDAERELAEMVARVRCVRAVGSRSTMSELFEAWFATAVVGGHRRRYARTDLYWTTTFTATSVRSWSAMSHRR